MPGRRCTTRQAVMACLAVLAASTPLLPQAKDGAQRHAAQVPVEAKPDTNWRGEWRMRWLPGTDAEDAASMQALQLRPSGQGWASQLQGERGADAGPVLRPFKRADYAELGWAQLHAAGRLQCLGAGMVVVCRTQPGASVPFFAAQGGTLTTESGLFGAMHQGGFELIPLD